MNSPSVSCLTICPLCGSQVSRACGVISRDYEHQYSGEVVFVGCPACGLLVQDPLPGRDELLGAYPDDYHAYHEYANALMMRLKSRYYVRRARMYGRLVGKPVARVLDVGCGDGNFMMALKQAYPTWDIRGVDFNPRIAARGRTRGLDIQTGTLEDMSYPSETFDLIIMNHMIEHAFDPLVTIEVCRRILRPAGLLVGETPNVDCWDLDFFKGYWGGLHAPRHTMLFTPVSIVRAAERAGLETVWVKHALQPAHPALSIQHWLQSRKMTRITLRNGRAFYYPFLLMLLLPVLFIQVLQKRSGVINFAFKCPLSTATTIKSSISCRC